MDQETPAFRSGFVALVGRPNAGKSTLLNAAVGHKVAAVSNVAQTTRRRMRAVINTPSSQLVIVDTPGLHKPKDALGKELNRSALGSLSDVDAVAMLVDAKAAAGRGDEWVAGHVKACDAPYKLLVITKADLVSPEVAAEQMQAVREMADFDDAIVVSAKEGFNVDSFVALVSAHMPEGPKWFPDDMATDATDEDLVSEFIREKAFLNLRQEIPHSLSKRLERRPAATSSGSSTPRSIWTCPFVYSLPGVAIRTRLPGSALRRKTRCHPGGPSAPRLSCWTQPSSPSRTSS